MLQEQWIYGCIKQLLKAYRDVKDKKKQPQRDIRRQYCYLNSARTCVWKTSVEF